MSICAALPDERFGRVGFSQRLSSYLLCHQLISSMGTTSRRTNSHGANDGEIESRPNYEPTGPRFQSNNLPFAGRLGANQACVIDGETSEDERLLEHQPDATPHMSFSELVDLRPITNLDLWKAAVIEGIGSLFISAP
ncbi:unnamed protein product [Fusarium venenatum]|uniref:Uncharacterized protein n=1 Tax=Fusarium venenatum TaxID=56646 RepID=A0A2L2TM67_9HYPO|nr:uncharacterized protein FVRRES_05976 [Fusarium venenatum]CEI61540.1 unnamed protein product [Fusarium venenatum]